MLKFNRRWRGIAKDIKPKTKSIFDILADMEIIIEDADGDLCILKRKDE